MLRYPLRWHDAANRLLLEEARLLRFSSGPSSPVPGSPDPLPTPDNTPHTAPAGPVLRQVTNHAHATHAHVEHVIAAPEAEEVSTLSYEEKLEETTKKFNVFHKKLANVSQKMHTIDHETLEREGMTHDEWHELEHQVDGWIGKQRVLKDILELCDTFESRASSQIYPSETIRFLTAVVTERKNHATELGDSTDQYDEWLRNLEAAGQYVESTRGSTDPENPDISTLQAWGALDDERRKKAYIRVRGVLRSGESIDMISRYNDAVSKKMQDSKLEEQLKQLQDTMKKTAQLEGWEDHGGGLGNPLALIGVARAKIVKGFGSIGIAFYTPRQLKLIVEEIFEAIHEIQHEQDLLKVAGGATVLGRALSVLPGLSHLETMMDTRNIKKNDEVKNGFKEALESQNWQPGFNDLFGHHGLLDHSYDDKNQTRAILEYATTRGMLYGISQMDDKNLFGNPRWNIHDLVPGNWSEKQVNSYWSNLIGDNTIGAKKRAEIGSDLVKQIETSEGFIKAIDGVLKDRDLWLAKGMIERAFDKGKSGKQSAWIATTVMHRIKSDHELRRLVPVEWFDEVGIISAKTAAFTLGYLNFQRKDILPWARSEDETTKAAGDLGRVIYDVEQDLIHKDHSLDPSHAHEGAPREAVQQKLNELVSRVLATETVEVNGQIVTIFDSRYNYYNAGSGGQREVDVKKLSDDFFNDRSEVLMCDPHIISQILAYGSTRLFDNEFRAKKLFSHAVRARKELQEQAKKMPGQATMLLQASERFRETFGDKMEKKFRELFRQSGTLTLTEFTLDDDTTPALMAMVRDGFVSLDVMAQGLASSDGNKLASTILKQCVNNAKTSADMKARINAMLTPRPTPPPPPAASGTAAPTAPTAAA